MDKLNKLNGEFNNLMTNETIRYESFKNFYTNFKKSKEELDKTMSNIIPKSQKGGSIDYKLVNDFQKIMDKQIKSMYTSGYNNNPTIEKRDITNEMNDFYNNYKIFDNLITAKLDKLHKYLTVNEKMNSVIKDAVIYGKTNIEELLISSHTKTVPSDNPEKIKNKCMNCIKLFGEELEKEYNKDLYTDTDKLEKFFKKMQEQFDNIRNKLYLLYLKGGDRTYLNMIEMAYKCYTMIIKNNMEFDKNMCARHYLPEREEDIIDPYA